MDDYPNRLRVILPSSGSENVLAIWQDALPWDGKADVALQYEADPGEVCDLLEAGKRQTNPFL